MRKGDAILTMTVSVAGVSLPPSEIGEIPLESPVISRILARQTLSCYNGGAESTAPSPPEAGRRR